MADEVQTTRDDGLLKQDNAGAAHAEPGDAEVDTEEEPRLKYQRLGSDVAELLGKNAATCLCVSDKILALGTHSGTVHVLDYSGNEVRPPKKTHRAIVAP
jgi:hypothetical protein